MGIKASATKPPSAELLCADSDRLIESHSFGHIFKIRQSVITDFFQKIFYSKRAKGPFCIEKALIVQSNRHQSAILFTLS